MNDNDPYQGGCIPIHEIHIPDEEDLRSELSTLLSHHNNNHGYHEQVGQHGSSRWQQTHPTGEHTSDSQDTSVTRRAFQVASVLALLSMCALLYADVSVNLRSAQDAAFDPWENVDDTPAITGDRVEDSVDDKVDSTSKKWSFWHNLRNSPDTDSEKRHKKHKKYKHTKSSKDDDDFIQHPRTTLVAEPNITSSEEIAAATSAKKKLHNPIDIPESYQRCDYVIQTFADQNVGVAHDFLKEKYAAQAVDPNVFYRATALLFWKDFAGKQWGKDQNMSIDLGKLVLLDEEKYVDGTPLSPMSTWTWITGDQHLSNFGAWRNRADEVVYGVNDFDEAAIYDFHIDVLRIAVSICNHGFTNGLTVEQISDAIEAFTYSYVKTAVGYVGGDAALLYELTADTSTGVLRDFLKKIDKNKSKKVMLEKFTDVNKDGVREFAFNDDTRLEDVPEELDSKIRHQMTSTNYGASMMKMGWRVRGWDDDFFQVLDIARRVGSGIGSFGVDRFYVLLKGQDESLNDGDNDPSVILDIKYEPKSAVARTINEETKAWYEHIFNNEADRVAQAQRALTSYTDPYVGWFEVDGNPYYIRQRSPWKAELDLSVLTDRETFIEFIEQIAVATATSHVRGTVAKESRAVQACDQGLVGR